MSNSNELKEKREIAQSEAQDKTAKIISGLVLGWSTSMKLYLRSI